MKYKSVFYCLITSLIIVACKESVVSFEETQPTDCKALQVFPSKILGSYYNPDENSELEIAKEFIIKKLMINDTLNMREIDENETIDYDTLYNSKTKEKYQIRRINDSLFSNYVLYDTIFIINKDHVLKKLKGHFFLNKRINKSDFWAVEKLSYSNEILNINRIETEEEMKLLQSITETKMDSTKPFSVKPTKKQFKEFLKKNGFVNGDTYLKKEIK